MFQSIEGLEGGRLRANRDGLGCFFLSVLLFARVAGAVGCRGASSRLVFDLRVA